MIYAGIDNGTLSGAICVISGSLIIDKATLPISVRNGKKELDVNAFWNWIYDTVQPQNFDNLLVLVEEPGGAKNYKAAVSMASCFHSIRSVLEIKGIKWQAVTPQKWQKRLLKAKAGETKVEALKLAQKTWPDEEWKATPRKKKSHTGLVDAALIAKFAQLNEL